MPVPLGLVAMLNSVAPTRSPHRYWRIRANSSTGGGLWVVSEARMFESTTGGTDVTYPGGAIYNDRNKWVINFGSGAIYDDNIYTYEYPHDPGAVDALNYWFGHDFGAGNEKDIKRIEIYQSGYGSQFTVTSVLVEYSDDGTNWTTAWTASGLTDAGGVWDVSVDPNA